MPRPKRVSSDQAQYFCGTAFRKLTEELGLNLQQLNENFQWSIRSRDLKDVFTGFKDFTQDEIDNILVDLRRVLYNLGKEDTWIDEWIYWPEAPSISEEEAQARRLEEARKAQASRYLTREYIESLYWFTEAEKQSLLAEYGHLPCATSTSAG